MSYSYDEMLTYHVATFLYHMMADKTRGAEGSMLSLVRLVLKSRVCLRTCSLVKSEKIWEQDYIFVAKFPGSGQ